MDRVTGVRLSYAVLTEKADGASESDVPAGHVVLSGIAPDQARAEVGRLLDRLRRPWGRGGEGGLGFTALLPSDPPGFLTEGHLHRRTAAELD